MLRWIAIVGTVVIVLAAIPASYFGLQNYCSLQQHREYENSNRAGTGEQHAAPEGKKTNPAATFNLRVTNLGEIEGSYYTKSTPPEKEDWVIKFWCDAKIGEFSLVVFTFFLVLFTGGLWFSTHRLWQATTEALRLGRDEFNASHSPELRLKHIWLATDDGARFFGKIEAGKRIIARLDVVNVGSATAIISLINFVTRIVPLGEKLPQRPPYNDGESAGRVDLPDGFPLNRGITFTQAVSDNRVLSAEEVRRIRNGEVRLYFIGTVEYWAAPDQAEAVRPRLRQTAFCRYLKFHSRPAHPEDNGRFEKDEDPDYEYQD